MLRFQISTCLTKVDIWEVELRKKEGKSRISNINFSKFFNLGWDLEVEIWNWGSHSNKDSPNNKNIQKFNSSTINNVNDPFGSFKHKESHNVLDNEIWANIEGDEDATCCPTPITNPFTKNHFNAAIKISIQIKIAKKLSIPSFWL